MELFNKIKNPVIMGERLILRDINKKDIDSYYDLYTDEDLNKYWGYNYKDDLPDLNIKKDYFYNFQQSLKDNKQEYSLAVTLNDFLIGEVVLHNFTCNSVETGIRISKKYQSFGYGREALTLLINYVKEVIKPDYITSKCYKINVRSELLLTKCGFIFKNEDEIYKHFIIDLTK